MKKEKRYFKVKYGFNVSDQVSIGEEELEKALYAQIKGVPVQLGNAYVNGRNIIAVTPHWHKHTGWYDYYEPNGGEDWEQIKRDCPSYEGIVESTKQKIYYLIQKGKENLIGKGIEVPELESPKEKNHQFSEETKSLGESFRI